MGSGKLDGNIPHFIRQQMKLNEEQFARAIGCPLTREEYIQILKDKKIIQPEPNKTTHPYKVCNLLHSSRLRDCRARPNPAPATTHADPVMIGKESRLNS
jgi:hypothetical protein